MECVRECAAIWRKLFMKSIKTRSSLSSTVNDKTFMLPWRKSSRVPYDTMDNSRNALAKHQISLWFAICIQVQWAFYKSCLPSKVWMENSEKLFSFLLIASFWIHLVPALRNCYSISIKWFWNVAIRLNIYFNCIVIPCTLARPSPVFQNSLFVFFSCTRNAARTYRKWQESNR